MSKLTGAEIVIQCLREQGVDTVFGYPGGAILNIYDALYQHQDEITHILTSHEQGASHAADGYARATGRVGVCLATSGPGATNLVTGIATAYMDSVPVVAITCNVTNSLLGKDSFQEIDITGVTMPITKYNFIVKDVNRLATVIRRAFTIAQTGRPGPVLVDITKDVTAAPCEYEKQVPEEIVRQSDTIREEDMERAIEARCLSLILRQQPVAGDLRQVSTALKVVTDLERIGDHASDIAELILRIKSDHAYHIVKHLPAMAAAAGKMVHDAIEAFINRDLDAAVSIIKRDDEVDNLFNQVKTDVIQLLRVSPDQADQGIDLLMVAKYLERIGDHAMNIAECAKEIAEKNIVFSEEATRELNTMFAAVQEITYNAITAFTTGDLELAYRIEPLEELIDSLCDEMKLHHVDRLQRGICQLTQGFVFNDLLTNYERVADHCSNIAVAMIELESDSFDTHEYLISLKKVRSHSFDQYYEDYRKKFSLPEV